MKIKVKARMKGAKGDKDGEKGCSLIFCIDSKTGALLLEKGGKCPPGTVKKINAAVRSRGVILPQEDDK